MAQHLQIARLQRQYDKDVLPLLRLSTEIPNVVPNSGHTQVLSCFWHDFHQAHP